jgi:hypothetical protein
MSSKNKKNQTESLIKLYSFFHITLILYSITVAYKCNNGLNVVATALAIMCPHLYLIYIASTKGLGFCFFMGQEIEDEE